MNKPRDKKRLNDLTGPAWVKLTKSVWISRKLVKWSLNLLLDNESRFVVHAKHEMKTMVNTLSDDVLDKLVELLTQKNQCIWCSTLLVNHASRLQRKLIKTIGQSTQVDCLLLEAPQFDSDAYQTQLTHFINAIEEHIAHVKSNGHIAIIVRDKRIKQHYVCCHADVIHYLQDNRLTLKGLINVIEDGTALKAYGYPSSYVPNIINQFVIIYQKN